ncbi:hypothetical protein N9A78_03505 [Akkermansiaceae bacterium]|nr:hypothetical protein [Akkermansiaceae bacterium]
MPTPTLLKILWIEDQPEENAAFVRDCAMEGYELVNARTAEKGIELLKDTPESFAGIILDALGYKKDTNEAIKTAGLHHALREIHSILPDIPKVVFTGQEKFVDDDDFQENIDLPVFYKHADNEPLYEKLNELIDARPNAELRRRYPAICNLCDDEFLPAQKWSETLFPALQETHEGTHNLDRFNGLRKVLEAALKSLCANGILPAFFDEGDKVNLTHCERFLSGCSVTPHDQNQHILHYYSYSALLDDTDSARLKLLKILCSEESHENQLHRTIADLSCAVFTLISLLPALKAISQSEAKWATTDFSQPTYEIPGQINKNGRFFNSVIKIKGQLRIEDHIRALSLQPKDKIWVKCRAGEKGFHEPIDVRPMD